MGTSIWSNTGVRRAAPLAAAVLVALVALVALAPAPARALEIGISDSNANTVAEPFWDGLGARSARIVVPWDIALTRELAGTRRREEFETYRALAASKGVSLFVVFAPSVDVKAPDTGDPIAPTVEDFSAGFTAFLARYPGVGTFGAWNEPNNPDARQYPLSGDPVLAAQYWLAAKAICPACFVVAGEFAGIAGDDAYVDAYQAALGDARPEAWGFHAHGDINSFQSNGPDSARVARYYLSKFQGQWGTSQIWIDEVGARYRDATGFVWGDASQQQSGSFLLGLGTLDPRIAWIYYYNYSNQCAEPARCAVQDRGLVSPHPFNGIPTDYDGFNRRRPVWDVIANRGPVIPPAAPVPPVVTITQPATAAVLGTATPAFTGAAAVGGRAAGEVSLQIFPGVSTANSVRPVQTITAPVVNGAWSATAARLVDGSYTARASQVGNRSSSGISQDVVFTVDTVAPTSTIAGTPPAVTGARGATFTLTASEPGATFLCSVDRQPAVPCTSPLTVTRLAPGRHSFGIRAVDLAGNVQARPTVVNWTVVSLATALLPRTADFAAAFSKGLPLAASCADACRVDARIYGTAAAARDAGLAGRRVSRRDPARPPGRGYLTLASGSIVRSGVGSSALALRLRASSPSAVAATRAVTLRVGFTVRPLGARRPLVVTRLVTFSRAGALRGLAAGGLPVTVACTSACAQRTTAYASPAVARAVRAPGRAIAGRRANGLPRGSYVSLASRLLRRTRAGATDTAVVVASRRVAARLPRLRNGIGLRVLGRANGVGTASRTLSWPLTLPR